MAPQDGRRREDKKMGKNERKPLTGEERTNTILSARLGSARLGSARLGSGELYYVIYRVLVAPYLKYLKQNTIKTDSRRITGLCALYPAVIFAF